MPTISQTYEAKARWGDDGQIKVALRRAPGSITPNRARSAYMLLHGKPLYTPDDRGLFDRFLDLNPYEAEALATVLLEVLRDGATEAAHDVPVYAYNDEDSA